MHQVDKILQKFWGKVLFGGLVAGGIVPVIMFLVEFRPPEHLWSVTPPGYDWFATQLARYESYPTTTKIHMVSALVFSVLSLAQFSFLIRRGYPKIHRIGGRIYILTTLFVTGSGLSLGVVIPFGGMAETIWAGVVSALVLMAAWRGLRCILNRNVTEHQKWMLRLFTWSMSIVTMRLYLGAFLNIQPFSDQTWFAVSAYLGLLTNMTLTEYFLNCARRTHHGS